MARQGGLTISLQGADTLSRAFDDLRASMKRRITKRAITKAARVVVPPLRRATPKARVYPKGSLSRPAAAKNPPGTLRKSTGLAFRKYRGGAIQSAYIGHRWFMKGFAAHLVDAGTKQRFTTGGKSKKAGISSGRVEGRRFFKPVWDAHKSQVHNTLQSELQAGLLAEVRKLKGNAGAAFAKRFG